MTVKEIEVFYNQYKKSLTTVANMEKRSLKECYSYEVWEKNRRLHSQKLRTLFVRNQASYENEITSLIRNPESLDDETAAMFLTHVDFFISEGYRDYGVTVPVLEVLLHYYDNRHENLRSMECAYFMGVCLMDECRYEEAGAYFLKACSLCRMEDMEELYERYRLMCAAYYCLECSVLSEHPEPEHILACYRKALRDWSGHEKDGILSEKKQKAIPSILRRLVIQGMMQGQFWNRTEFDEILSREEEYESALPGDEQDIVTLLLVKEKQAFWRGEISQEEYRTRICSLYEQEAKRFKLYYTFGNWNLIQLFDDELPDETFSPDKLFRMNPSFSFMNYLVPETLRVMRDEKEREPLYRMVSRYFLEFPFINGEGSVDIHLGYLLSCCMKTCTAEERILDWMQNIFAHRQTATAIHSMMVGMLAEKIARELIKSNPEIFAKTVGGSSDSETQTLGLPPMQTSDILPMRTPSASQMRMTDIPEFLRKAGLCHDVGKIYCSRVINLQTRKILDAEFAVIKCHPEDGYRMLSESPAMSCYADVTRGHHKSCDGRGGYPRDYDNTASPQRIFTDLITICDSIDAATDTLGRNYATGKSFKQVLSELQELKGRRYSAELVDAISERPDLCKELEELLTEERARVQYEVYRRFVEPDTKFLSDDEKHIRCVKEDDLDRIVDIFDCEADWQKDIYEKSDYSYLLVDGRDEIYGTAFCRRWESRELEIPEIIIRKDSRHCGYGTMLLEHLEMMAHLEGFAYIRIPNETKDHNDKFAWNNGYTLTEDTKYLRKDI